MIKNAGCQQRFGSGMCALPPNTRQVKNFMSYACELAGASIAFLVCFGVPQISRETLLLLKKLPCFGGLMVCCVKRLERRMGSHWEIIQSVPCPCILRTACKMYG